MCVFPCVHSFVRVCGCLIAGLHVCVFVCLFVGALCACVCVCCLSVLCVGLKWIVMLRLCCDCGVWYVIVYVHVVPV